LYLPTQEAEQTPINKEIHHFIQIISAIAFALGISFFAAALGMGQDAVTSLVFMIGIIVANVRISASRRVHETRGHLTSMSVVSFWISSHVGPRRGRRRGDGVFMRPHRLDDVDAAAGAPTRLARESRSCRDGVVPRRCPRGCWRP
jgi:hypothetical protein